MTYVLITEEGTFCLRLNFRHIILACQLYQHNIHDNEQLFKTDPSKQKENIQPWSKFPRISLNCKDLLQRLSFATIQYRRKGFCSLPFKCNSTNLFHLQIGHSVPFQFNRIFMITQLFTWLFHPFETFPVHCRMQITRQISVNTTRNGFMRPEKQDKW